MEEISFNTYDIEKQQATIESKQANRPFDGYTKQSQSISILRWWSASFDIGLQGLVQQLWLSQPRVLFTSLLHEVLLFCSTLHMLVCLLLDRDSRIW
jgi:hypothetical protein